MESSVPEHVGAYQYLDGRSNVRSLQHCKLVRKFNDQKWTEQGILRTIIVSGQILRQVECVCDHVYRVMKPEIAQVCSDVHAHMTRERQRICQEFDTKVRDMLADTIGASQPELFRVMQTISIHDEMYDWNYRTVTPSNFFGRRLEYPFWNTTGRYTGLNLHHIQAEEPNDLLEQLAVQNSNRYYFTPLNVRSLIYKLLKPPSVTESLFEGCSYARNGLHNVMQDRHTMMLQSLYHEDRHDYSNYWQWADGPVVCPNVGVRSDMMELVPLQTIAAIFRNLPHAGEIKESEVAEVLTDASLLEAQSYPGVSLFDWLPYDSYITNIHLTYSIGSHETISALRKQQARTATIAAKQRRLADLETKLASAKSSKKASAAKSVRSLEKRIATQKAKLAKLK